MNTRLTVAILMLLAGLAATVTLLVRQFKDKKFRNSKGSTLDTALQYVMLVGCVVGFLLAVWATRR